jgi:hypothetical protein
MRGKKRQLVELREDVNTLTVQVEDVVGRLDALEVPKPKRTTPKTREKAPSKRPSSKTP